ncbi:unnamed protein product [Effrenium voratum]|nr:unnamed protein product [Effrenium voratum]
MAAVAMAAVMAAAVAAMVAVATAAVVAGTAPLRLAMVILELQVLTVTGQLTKASGTVTYAPDKCCASHLLGPNPNVPPQGLTHNADGWRGEPGYRWKAGGPPQRRRGDYVVPETPVTGPPEHMDHINSHAPPPRSSGYFL